MAKRPKATIGFRAHTGWAAAVTLAPDDADGVTVIDRRRIDLHDPGMPLEMYHVAASRRPREAEALIQHAAKASGAMAKREIAGLVVALESRGYDVAAAGVVLGSGRLILPLEAALRSHAGSHAAEGELYRQAVIHGCEACGLRVTGIAEPELYEFGAAALDMSVDRLRARVATLGDGLGPPWRQDQKSAALVAWLAMRKRRR